MALLLGFFAFSGMANIAQQNARYEQSELVFPAMRLTKSSVSYQRAASRDQNKQYCFFIATRSILLWQYRNIINAESIIKKDEEEGIATG
jgi:hypothetical protein